MSPIHDQGYRRYLGERVPDGRAWLVIARTGVRTLLARRAFLGLLLLAWFPFLGRAALMYASENLPQATLFATTPETFREFLEMQELFLFPIVLYAGAGLIANDRRANALQIYLSKPLTRFEYIFGKLAILMAFMLFVTWLPAVLLLVIQVLFSGAFTFLVGNLWLFPAITLFSIIQVVTVSSAMLALSSLSRSSRYVGILYAALIFLSQAMYGVLFVVTRDPRFSWISMPFNLRTAGDVIFGLPLQFKAPVPVAFLMLLLLVAASGVILNWRVRGVEVVR